MTDDRSSDTELFDGWSASDRGRMQEALQSLAAHAECSGSIDEQAHWATIDARLDAAQTMRRAKSAQSVKQERARFRTGASRWVWGAVTATAAIAIGGSLSRRSDPPARSREYRTNAGERSTVHMANGTEMILGPATTVRVRASEVDVTGEVYFSVVPNPRETFVVRTSRSRVQVLGTRFTVRQYPSDSTTRVVVEDGRVSLQPTVVQRRDSSIVLSAQTIATVGDSGVRMSSGIATASYTEWTRGELSFDEIPLGDVVRELGRVYDADIRITDSALTKRRVSIDVSVSHQTLASILEPLCDVSNAHYTQRGHQYTIAAGKQTRAKSSATPFDRTSTQPETQYGR